MTYIERFRRQILLRVFICVIVPVVLTLITWLVTNYLGFETLYVLTLCAAVGSSSLVVSVSVLVSAITKPVERLQEVISFASNNNRQAEPPVLDDLRLGRELIAAQAQVIYDIASVGVKSQKSDDNSSNVKTLTNLDYNLSSDTQSIIDSIPVPVLGLDAEKNIIVTNKAVEKFLSNSKDKIYGRPYYDVLNLSFQDEDTLSKWSDSVSSNNLTASKTWSRVKHTFDQDNVKMFDLAVSYSKNNTSGVELMLAIFDNSEFYNRESQDASFVALAVHELRTPLTVLNGYIEVFEDELSDTLSQEHKSFLSKMHANAQQLTAFVGNILNVSKIEENQLSLKLRKESIKDILEKSIEDLRLRASVRGIDIELLIAKDIPEIGADRISVHEIINNLVENAIKYSDKSDKIRVIGQLNSQNVVQVDVQDYGIGIPSSVIGRLFQKYHRSHKSSAVVGGTGLGLYLCKSLVNAHGGNIWVNSKEGEGSIFSFTLVPYDQLSDEQIAGEDGIIRGAHGWIKNHSLYRN